MLDVNSLIWMEVRANSLMIWMTPIVAVHQRVFKKFHAQLPK